MKLYKAIRFLMLSGILTLVLSRCIRESLEGCPLDTLLRFTYKPRGSAADLFGERVQRVRLCVYRPDGSIEHMRRWRRVNLTVCRVLRCICRRETTLSCSGRMLRMHRPSSGGIFRRRNHKEPFRLTPACGDFRFHPHA